MIFMGSPLQKLIAENAESAEIFVNLPGSPRASAIKDAAKACPCSAGRQACIRRLKPTLHYLQTIQGR
jgi:hypothetical protein